MRCAACASFARALHAHGRSKQPTLAHKFTCLYARAKPALIADVLVHAWQAACVHERDLVPYVRRVRILNNDIVHVRIITCVLTLIAHPL